MEMRMVIGSAMTSGLGAEVVGFEAHPCSAQNKHESQRNAPFLICRPPWTLTTAPTLACPPRMLVARMRLWFGRQKMARRRASGDPTLKLEFQINPCLERRLWPSGMLSRARRNMHGD